MFAGAVEKLAVAQGIILRQINPTDAALNHLRRSAHRFLSARRMASYRASPQEYANDHNQQNNQVTQSTPFTTQQSRTPNSQRKQWRGN
jgi:hypothetical protein